DHDGQRARVGHESRYRATYVYDPSAVVQTLRRLGSESYAIVATPASGRSLARLRGGRWELLRHPASAEPASPPAIRELWLRGEAGSRYQAFLFGDPGARRVAVWWHGGPHENVSPRFNPYFQRLSELGFAVLAVNYPGSTGRGADYERAWRRPEVEDCIDAVWRQLAELRPSHVVSWSVSIGVRVQSLLLLRGHPLSGAVDQAGWGRTPLVGLADARGLPLFTIRGRFDPGAPVERVSFEYEGGHDLQRGEDFVALFERLAPFLAELSPVVWPLPESPAS
ncbi:MAG: alpha/beta hydrolase family protein, partial [Myxococcota bacterium]